MYCHVSGILLQPVQTRPATGPRWITIFNDYPRRIDPEPGVLNLAPSLVIRDGHNADPDGKIIVSRAVGGAHQLLDHSLPRPFIA